MNKFLAILACFWIVQLGGVHCCERPPAVAPTEQKQTSDLHELKRELFQKDADVKSPLVLVALIIQNRAFALPLFLTYFERLNYSKKRMVLWIRSNRNSDASGLLLELWLNHTAARYRSVDFMLDRKPELYPNEEYGYLWAKKMHTNFVYLKESALKYAQQIDADYTFFLDANELLTYADTLKHLISLQLPVVAPALGDYEVNNNAKFGRFYMKTNPPAYTRQVSVISQAMLLHMKHKATPYLTFDGERFKWMQQQMGGECLEHRKPIAEFAVFGAAAACLDMPLHVSYKHHFGYMITPSIYGATLETNLMQFRHIKAFIHNHAEGMAPISDYFKKYIVFPPKTKLTLDHIYMINLERRPDRRAKMENVFNELGLDVEHFMGVDGRNLNENTLKELNITIMPGYVGVNDLKPIKTGEIGCFLSHYNLWKKIVELKQKRVLILEDDINFYTNFTQKALKVLKEAKSLEDYDLLYLARKRLTEELEPWLQGNGDVKYVGYSFWTIGYVITLQGAEKLLAAKPLEKLIPVDEFLPIMSKCHPNKAMRDAFPVRNLITLSSKHNLFVHLANDSDTDSMTFGK